MPGSPLSSEELRLAKLWYNEDGVVPSEIARLLRRAKSTITRAVVQELPRGGRGRKRLLSDAEVDAIIKCLERLVDEAGGRKEVTLHNLHRESGCRASCRTLARALHNRHIKFHRLRSKPLLTDIDVAERLAFARKHRCHSGAWWEKHIHMHIDCKHFQIFLHAGARTHAASRRIRGVYRLPGQGLGKAYVRADKRLKYNPGARGVQVLAGVGKGKMLVWQYIEGPWNSETAANIYKGPIRNALKKAYPRQKSWRVLEDNDPAGFKSGAGRAAKRSARIAEFNIPKRSPDLNVLDYAIWAEINKRMRKQEERFPEDKVETRGRYLARLRRTALRLPRRFITSCIRNMQKRCVRMRVAEGYHFEEGGT